MMDNDKIVSEILKLKALFAASVSYVESSQNNPVATEASEFASQLMRSPHEEDRTLAKQFKKFSDELLQRLNEKEFAEEEEVPIYFSDAFPESDLEEDLGEEVFDKQAFEESQRNNRRGSFEDRLAKAHRRKATQVAEMISQEIEEEQKKLSEDYDHPPKITKPSHPREVFAYLVRELLRRPDKPVHGARLMMKEFLDNYPKVAEVLNQNIEMLRALNTKFRAGTDQSLEARLDSLSLQLKGVSDQLTQWIEQHEKLTEADPKHLKDSLAKKIEVAKAEFERTHSLLASAQLKWLKKINEWNEENQLQVAMLQGRSLDKQANATQEERETIRREFQERFCKYVSERFQEVIDSINQPAPLKSSVVVEKTKRASVDRKGKEEANTMLTAYTHDISKPEPGKKSRYRRMKPLGTIEEETKIEMEQPDQSSDSGSFKKPDSP